MTHTPGPWFVVDDEREGMEDNRHICRDEAGDHRLAFMATGYDNEADAALMAAAPDMKKALQQCRAELWRNLQRERSEQQRLWIKTAIDTADAALAKALAS